MPESEKTIAAGKRSFRALNAVNNVTLYAEETWTHDDSQLPAVVMLNTIASVTINAIMSRLL